MGQITLFFLVSALPLVVFCRPGQKIVTQDLDNFWTAYDSINTTTDRDRQLRFINNLYIEKGSEGLKAFLRNKEKPDSKWVDLIGQDRAFWDSIRPKTLVVKTQVEALERNISRLQALYPGLKDAATSFLIGFRQQGGTIRNNLSLIGTEVVVSQPGFCPADLARICLHEYVHTQQVKPDFRNLNVLTSSVREGACDFVAERVLGRNLTMPYLRYGQSHPVQVWQVFRQDMLTAANDLWVSTGDNPVLPAKDLGYYTGYVICRSYYETATDKQKALKDIINLDYANAQAVVAFLDKSGYENSLRSKGYQPRKRLPNEGYVRRDSTVTFVFSPVSRITIVDEDGRYKRYNPEERGPISAVSVAGEFNGWDLAHSVFQLKKTKRGTFALPVDKRQLGQNGQAAKFRFVLNNKYWVVPNFAVGNRVTDNEGHTNLYVPL